MLFCFMSTPPKVNVISKYMLDNGITKTWLASQFGVTSQAIGERLSKTDMETTFVRRCSEIMNHNFFMDLAKTVVIEKGKPKPYPVRDEEENVMADFIENLVEEKIANYMRKQSEGLSRKKSKKK